MRWSRCLEGPRASCRADKADQGDDQFELRMSSWPVFTTMSQLSTSQMSAPTINPTLNNSDYDTDLRIASYYMYTTDSQSPGLQIFAPTLKLTLTDHDSDTHLPIASQYMRKTNSQSPGPRMSAPTINPSPTDHDSVTNLPIASYYMSVSRAFPTGTGATPNGHSRNLSAPPSTTQQGSNTSANDYSERPLSSVQPSRLSSSTRHSSTSYQFHNVHVSQYHEPQDEAFDSPCPSDQENDKKRGESSQLNKYAKQGEEDQQQLRDSEHLNPVIHRDMQICRAILEKIEGSPAHAHFQSTMQHLLLIHAKGDQRTRYYRLIDTLVTSIVRNREVDFRGTQSHQAHIAVERLLARLEQQDQTHAATDVATEKLRAELEQVTAERDALRDEVAFGVDRPVEKFNVQLTGAEETVKTSRQTAEELKTRLCAERIQQLERQTQELFGMLRDANISEVSTAVACMSRTKLISSFQKDKRVERKKAHAALQRTRTKRRSRQSAKPLPSRMLEEKIEVDNDDENEKNSDTQHVVDPDDKPRASKIENPWSARPTNAKEFLSTSHTDRRLQDSESSVTVTEVSDMVSKIHKPQAIRRDALKMKLPEPAPKGSKLPRGLTPTGNKLAVGQSAKGSKLPVVTAEGAAPHPRKVTPPPTPLPVESITSPSPGSPGGAAMTSGVPSDMRLSDLVDDTSDSDDDSNILNGDFKAAALNEDEGTAFMRYNESRQRVFSMLTFHSGTVFDDSDPTHVAAKGAYYGDDDIASTRSFNSLLL